MDWEETLAIVFCAVIPLGLLGGIIFSRTIEKEQGEEAANKYNTPILIVIAALVFLTIPVRFLFSIISIPLSSLLALQLLFTILLAAGLILLVVKRLRLRKEIILLNLGSAESKIGLLFVFIFISLTLLNLLEIIAMNENDENNFIETILYGVGSSFYLMTTFGTVYITDEGFSRLAGGTIKWVKITDYEWIGRKNDKLRLKSEGKVIATFSIPKKRREQVIEILNTKILLS